MTTIPPSLHPPPTLVLRSPVLTGRIQKTDGRPIGCGGLADVYRATLTGSPDQILEVPLSVAVKVLRCLDQSRKPDVQRRLLREICVWLVLNHPNIAPFLGITTDFGEHGLPSLVSPYYSHGNVMNYLKTKPDVDKILIVTQVASGLAYLHAHSIVHGDMKGCNILIDDDGAARITDFGLSRILDKSGFTTLAISGTMRYLPIESFADVIPPVTRQRDVWSCAMTFVEIMSGAIPFPHMHDARVVIFVASGGRPQRTECVNVGPDLWKKLETCWDEDPTRRPAMAEVHQFLVSHHPSYPI